MLKLFALVCTCRSEGCSF